MKNIVKLIQAIKIKSLFWGEAQTVLAKASNLIIAAATPAIRLPNKATKPS